MEEPLLARHLEPELFKALASAHVVNIVGPGHLHNEPWKSLPLQERDWRLYHWRHEKRENDLIAEADRTLVGFEMKTSTAMDASDFRHLALFRDEGPGKTWNVIGIVVYMGDRMLSFGKNLFALPLSPFWSFEA